MRGKKQSSDNSDARDEYAKILKALGWSVDKLRGKGEHWWCTRPGHAPFPLPGEIKPGLEKDIKNFWN